MWNNSYVFGKLLDQLCLSVYLEFLEMKLFIISNDI